MRILDFQRKQTNLCGHGKNFRAIVAEINLRDRVFLMIKIILYDNILQEYKKFSFFVIVNFGISQL